MISITLSLLICFILISLSLADIQESGFSFADVEGGLKLAGVGTRIKKIGPVSVKVYAAGIYLDKYSTVSACSSLKSKSSKDFSSAIGPSIIQGKFDKSIMLKMCRTVGTDAMVSALADAVRPRLGGHANVLESFKTALAKSFGQTGAIKEKSILKFDSQRGGKLKVSLDGKFQAEIQSSALCDALFGVYTDKSAVIPTLKANVASSVHTWLN